MENIGTRFIVQTSKPVWTKLRIKVNMDNIERQQQQLHCLRLLLLLLLLLLLSLLLLRASASSPGVVRQQHVVHLL